MPPQQVLHGLGAVQLVIPAEFSDQLREAAANLVTIAAANAVTPAWQPAPLGITVVYNLYSTTALQHSALQAMSATYFWSGSINNNNIVVMRLGLCCYHQSQGQASGLPVNR
eukprot:GHUV01027242.1.p1 GENE.GHUV01027242.1~~GHUV01027242.1.p1  ORF type:complete len:112 (-),score=24.42 GHUV01027242.1:806-1141(-)